MKRRLALLLALSLTFASVPVTGVSAAEEDAAAATTVTIEAEAEEAAEVVEEQNDTEEEQQTTVEDEKETVSETEDENSDEEASQQGSTEETAEETEVESEAAENVENEETAETEATEATEESADSEEAATEAATGTEADTETAAVEEPSAAIIEDSELATVVEEAVVEEKAAETQTASKKAVKDSSGNILHLYINGSMVKNDWAKISIGGKTYTFYFDEDGKPKTGFKTVEGYVRYFADDRYSSMPKGAMLTGWKIIGGNKFYLLKKAAAGMPVGTQLTGWRSIDGKKYYFVDSQYPYSDVTGKLLTSFKTIGGKRYYLGTDGAMKTGFKTVNGKKYYMADSRYPSITKGVVVTGVRTISGNAYYFNPKAGGAMATGWVKTTSGLWAYYTSSGAAGSTGWKLKSDNDWFYLNKNGQAKTGWLKLSSTSIFYLSKAKGGRMITQPTAIGGKIYFFDTDGRRAVTKGWKAYGMYNYYTYANGTVATNTTIDGVKLDKNGRTVATAMDRKAQNYSSDTNYLILVDKSTYKVCVYKGKKGAWTRIKGEWMCTHGGSNTPAYTDSGDEKYITIVGRLTKRSAEYGWGDFTYTSAAFCMQLSSGNFFHSILYPKGSRSNPYNLYPEDSNLGKNYSHGCIRLKTENAEWIWDNIPSGTRVVVYNS